MDWKKKTSFQYFHITIKLITNLASVVVDIINALKCYAIIIIIMDVIYESNDVEYSTKFSITIAIELDNVLLIIIANFSCIKSNWSTKIMDQLSPSKFYSNQLTLNKPN